MIAFVNTLRPKFSHIHIHYPLFVITVLSAREHAHTIFFFISYATSATTCYISLYNSGLDGGRRGGRSDRRKVYLLKKAFSWRL